jgi:glycosyltransferase involved in cell wall biosynthesis
MRNFICQAVPNEALKELTGISQAGNNFCFSFIEATDPGLTFSVLPVSIGKRVRFDPPGNLKMQFIQVRLFPQRKYLRGINNFFENILLIRKILLRNEKNTWFYNLSPSYLLTFLFLQFLTSRRCYIVVADYYPPVKRMDYRRVIRFLMRRSSGIIALSEGVQELVGHPRCRIVPGIVNASLSGAVHGQRNMNRSQVLFSGSLDPYAGYDLAIAAFKAMPERELIVSGAGPGENEILEATKNHPNIVFKGFVPYDEYLDIAGSVDIAVSLRNPAHSLNQFNFPSKIMELLSMGKIIISTVRYPLIPEEHIFYTGYNLDSLTSTLKRVFELPEEEICRISDKNREFVTKEFSYKSWCDRVVELEKNQHCN